MHMIHAKEAACAACHTGLATKDSLILIDEVSAMEPKSRHRLIREFIAGQGYRAGRGSGYMSSHRGRSDPAQGMWMNI